MNRICLSIFLFLGLLTTLSYCKRNYSKSRCCPPGCCPPGCCSVKQQEVASSDSKGDSQGSAQKEIIKEAYGKVVQAGSGCCVVGGGCCGGGADLSQDIGYSKKELKALADANLGLGCGNPVSFGEIKEGYTVLDLGSGAGLDCFLAAEKVGSTGAVIGVDMTLDMIKKARKNAKKYRYKNVEFRLGDIEALPVAENIVDIVISNCVINLAPDKLKVFKESYRVLKPGGRMYVSDVVLLGDLTEEQRKDEKLLCACVAGALLKEDYLAKLAEAGFEITIVEEDKEINIKWFNDDLLPIESLKYIAHKR